MSGVFRPINPLPIAVEIRKLCDHIRDNRLEYGCRRFTMVTTFGRVFSSHDTADVSSICYKLHDPRDNSATIDAIHFKGLKSSSQPTVFDEESLLFVVAKLTTQRGKLALQAFKLREVTNVAEYEAFCMEAILAWDYHTKVNSVKLYLRNSFNARQDETGTQDNTPKSVPRHSLPSVSSVSPATPASSNKRSFTRAFSAFEPALKKPPMNRLPPQPQPLKRHYSFDDDDVF